MTRKNGLLKILLIDDDQGLISDTRKLVRPGIEFSCIPLDKALASKVSPSAHDAIVIGIDSARAPDLLVELCGQKGSPPVIALAGRSARGVSLEHVLTLAELRGAALALPKPIDAGELALAVLEVVGSKPGNPALAKGLERRRAS